MQKNLRPGEPFPDIELPNQDEERTRLSSLMGGFEDVTRARFVLAQRL